MPRLRYDLAPGDPPPAAGDAMVSISRVTGLPTGTWWAITSVKGVAHRRPRPYASWSLGLVRQEGPPPDVGPGAWPVTTYPRMIDLDAYWEDRLGADSPV